MDNQHLPLPVTNTCSRNAGHQPYPFIKRAVATILFFISLLQGFSQTADFTFTANGNVFCSPATVQFTQTATGTPIGFIWDLGNTATSNAANPATTYAMAGNFTVKLTVIYENIALTVSKTVTINPAASITVSASRNYICQPGPVTFTASGNAPFIWSFGDGSTATTTTPSTVHTYAALGSYAVSLTASNVQGCTATASTQISVMAPAITASVSPQSGCIPATANFTASVNAPVGATISSYAWNFGDGTTAATATTGISHIYGAAGAFTPSLTITTNEGCTNTFNFNTLYFGTPPVNMVAYLKEDTICGSETLRLVAKAANANNYNWVYGDGTSENIPDTLALHKFVTLGNKSITVTPSFNGCGGTAQTLSAVIKGVIANFASANSCNSRQTFNFNNISLGSVTGIAWSFGDGATATNVNSVTHTYAAPGQYPVKMVVADSVAGCVDSFRQTIFYASPVLAGNDTLVCKGSAVNVSINGNYANPAARYTWFIAGDIYGPVPDATLSYITNTHGLFNNYVVIDNGPGYCTDTIRQAKPLRVRGLQVNFTSADSICLNTTLTATNTSAPFYPADTARLYYWNFGGQPVNDTVIQPAAHQYANAGSYTAALYGVDKNGCRDSLKKTITVNPVPFVRSIPAMDTLCAGQIKTLVSFHSDSVRWAPAAQAGCINCDTITVSPGNTTLFIATAYNAAGCTSSDTSVVKVFSPFAASTSFTDTSICLNDTLRLMALPPGKKVLWQPASSLSSATIYNPVAGPAQTTQYSVALTDSAGCFSDTAYVTVAIDSLPVADAGPSRIYPYDVLFNFEPTYGPNVATYNWAPGSLLNCTSCPIPTGRNQVSQTYTLTVTSAQGCVARDSVIILVACKDTYLLMPTAFSPDNNGLNDYYYPLTRGVGTIKNFGVYNRSGRLVYQASNFSPNDKRFGWDGRYKGEPQPIGTYVFMLEAVCDAGQTITRKGSFMLLR